MKKALLIGAASIAAYASNAEWQILQEFDDASSLYQEEKYPGNGAEAVVEDGQLKIVHGNVISQTNNLYCMVDLGADVKQASLDLIPTLGEDDAYVTAYYEINQPTVDSVRLVKDDDGNVVFDSYAYMADGTSAVSDGTYTNMTGEDYIVDEVTYAPDATIPAGVLLPAGTPVPEGYAGAEIDYDNSVPSTTTITDKAKVDVVFGFSNVDEAELTTERYNSFNAMLRIDSGSDQFEGRDGSGFASDDGIILDADVTYSVWMTANYYYNDYQIFIKGDSFDEHNATYADRQIDVASLTDGIYEVTAGDYYAFRVVPLADDESTPDIDENQTVDKFAFITSRGNTEDGEKGIDHLYLDNLALDATGPNLTVPVIGGSELPGNVDDATYGNVYVYGSALEEGVWLWQYNAETFIYVGTQSAEGDWAWYAK